MIAQRDIRRREIAQKRVVKMQPLAAFSERVYDGKEAGQINRVRRSLVLSEINFIEKQEQDRKEGQRKRDKDQDQQRKLQQQKRAYQH